MKKQKELSENLSPTSEDANSNVIDFKSRTALGGGTPPTDTPGWLKELKTGTIFLVRERNTQEFVMTEWIVEGHSERSTFLLTKPNVEVIVDPIRFSRKFELIEVLQTSEEFEYLRALKEQEEKARELLNDSHGTVRRSDMDNDEDVVARHQPDEEEGQE